LKGSDMKTLGAIGVCALLLASSRVASAADQAACLSASSQGQTLRDAHKLIEAREQLRVCAAASCPAVVQKDCTMWLDDIEKMLPTVVLSAKDGNGSELSDVRVSENGKVIATSLDGVAIPMNPGAHTLRFELKDGKFVEQRTVVQEGKKAFPVTAAFPKAPEPSAPAAAPVSPVVAPPVTTETAAVSPEAQTTAKSGGRSRVPAYVVGGVGVAGIVVGSITGLMAMSKKNTADQNCTGSQCNSTGADAGKSGKTMATVSTLAFGVGIAGLAVGTILWFTAKPATTEAPVTGVRAWQASIEPLPAGGVMLSTGRAW
jgi:hypothetical protein